MRAVASEIDTLKARAGSRPGNRSAKLRKTRLRQMALEALETRALMATIPGAVVTNQVDVSNSGGNQSSPSIAVDPTNPLNVVSVWTRIDPNLAPGPTVITEGAYSTNGGGSWTKFSPNSILTDPTSSATAPAPYAQTTDATVDFDRNGNFYVLVSEHTASNSAGSLVLNKFNLSSGTAAHVISDETVYNWSVDQAVKPTLAVDDNLATFTDGASTQTDLTAGDIYIAWGSVDANPNNFNNWNPNAIRMIASGDGGQSFSGMATVNAGGNFGAQRDTAPRIVISQGNVSGTVTGGKVTAVWDDFGTLALATPTPLDRLMTSSITGLTSLTASAAPGVIPDAGANNTPTTTPFNINVPAGANFTVADLTVTLDVSHPSDTELSAVLKAPDGTLVPLFNSGNVTGVNLGIGTGGALLGTTFDVNSPRALANGAAPYIGSFRPAGNLGVFFGQTIQTGTWQLLVTDSNTNNIGFLNKAQLTFSSGLAVGANIQAATTTVRGTAGSSYSTASAADPLGIGPDASLASDNTLGAFSPFEGRLYLTYVNRSTTTGNPTDNTDISLITSNNGGLAWSAPILVNNDVATTDGFSEGSGSLAGISGREQFEPSVAVDEGTGTLVITYYDGRYDAARARVAMTIATSIDGGASFGPQNFANTPLAVRDEATGQTVTLGPIPDNESSGNTATGKDTTFAFGDHQSVAVSHGHVYPAWSSNLNGGNDGKQLLNIRVATGEIAAGPRIISSTMGPVGQPGDAVNNTTAADGTPIAKAFVITFDRPVDPSTFGIGAVQVFFRDTTPTNATGGFVAVTGVTPLNANALGATQFRVNFTPSSAVGTYSYSISPVVQDRIRSQTTVFTTQATNTFTAVGPQVPLPFQDGTGGSNFPTSITSTVPVAGIPAGRIITGATVNLTITYPFTGDLVLTLIAPDGTRVVLVNERPSQFAGNGDPTSGYINTTFDDAAAMAIGAAAGAPYTGAFKPDGALAALKGKAPNGTWQLEVDDNFPAYDGSIGSLVNWSMTLKTGTATSSIINGNAMDQNANSTTGETGGGGSPTDSFSIPTPVGTAPFIAPYTLNTLPLIVPGPHVVSTSVPGGVVDSPSGQQTLMLNGTVSAINVTFDRDMNAASFTPSKVLRIAGPAGLINGPFTITPVNARTFQIGFPVQQLSGTYTVTLDSSITSASGYALDTNLNAGLDLLRGTSSTAPVPVTFNSANVPVTLAPGRTSSSTITLTDNFVSQGLTLTLDITDPNDPDLSAVLIAPDGTMIPLFTGVGTTGNHQNFTTTVFDDNATTPITNGGPPFFGRFKPQQPLGVLTGFSSVTGPGGTGTGVYTLQITNNSATNTGTLNSWSITLQKPTPGTDLGEPVADRPQFGFRIFTMDPTNPLASNTWTSVGPASIGGSNSGRIGGLAIDPSDPSGNTVYVAGATGGVWKTNNFLTTNAAGPTYIPITDFGPTFGINIGGLAVFGRNNDPNQSVVVVATGDGDGGNGGVGFLISKDAGATWALMDSTDNTLPLAQRDHEFLGSTAFKVVVDPQPTPDGNVIIYAALSGNNGGLWRSTDTGLHWGVVNNGKRVANFSGQATDVVLDPNSGPIDAVSNPTGNLQVVYAAFRGNGVYISPNQGQVWNIMAGGVGDPLIQDPTTNPVPKPIPVNNGGVNPNGPQGRIVLAKPSLFPASSTNATLKNFIYQGFLYAAVVTPDNHLSGLYLTKDNGQNWTKLTIPNLPPINNVVRAVPTNDTTQTNYDPLGNATFAQGNYDVSLAVDPVNPDVVYLGGTLDGNPTGLIRIDVTAVNDAHSFYQSDSLSDGGTLTVNSVGGTALKQNPLPPVGGYDPRSNPTINLIRTPGNPLVGNATFYVNNVTSFANTGAGVSWIPFDQGAGFTDQHRVVTMVDPLTGQARLIFGDDQGVFSSVDNGDGTISRGIGTAILPSNSRNGNLQITQFYYGASQPSNAAAQIANSLFYGQAQDDGFPSSDPNLLTDGNIRWTGPTGDGTGVATDQTGTGTLYQYNWPCCGGNVTDFFQVNGVGRTNGLIQASGGGNVPDPQWPYVAGFNFSVNPINGKQIAISSGAGRIFRTEDQGLNWLVIGDPAVFGGSNAPAIAFGAPDPALTGGSLDNFIYAGTSAGHIYVTFTGGGANGNTWNDISAGLDGSGVQAIVADPTRTSHDAFAVTSRGVYFISDSNPAAGQTWQKITGNLFQITHNSFGQAAYQETQLRFLTSLAVDWRYVIPDTPGAVAGPTHPLLYVGGDGGVYTSSDKGKTWALFPSPVINSVSNFPTPPGVGGGLPNAQVNDLDMALGNVDPTTGRAVNKPGDPNVLLATTYGRGSFAIRLSPLVLPNSQVAPAPPDRIFLDATSLGGTTATTGYQYTLSATPAIDGSSEQSAFGNTVTVQMFDLTNGTTNPPVIPLTGSVQTDANGRFALHVAPGYFTTSGIYTVGLQATDQAGTKGNIAEFTFVVDLTPPPPPTALVLDSTTDSGTSNTDQYTSFNNSNNNAPLFDVSGVQAGASVVLLRATELNGVVGAFSVVNTVTNTAGGTIQINDINGGNGKIADNPVNTPPDTPPNQANQYVYQAFQIDILNVPGTSYTSPLGVIVDTTTPAPPAKVTLDLSTDSGTSNGDNYTNFNNSNNAPLFDITGIEPNATVQLIRTDTNGNSKIVNIVTNVTPTGPNNMVQVADINGNNTPIPDNVVGAPPDTAPPSGNPYVYTAIQIDLAGNPSGQSTPTFGNKGAIVLDGTDADNHGDFNTVTGQNEDGWLYMQKVVTAIAPNITDGQKILVALGANPAIPPGVGPNSHSAVQGIFRAFQQSGLPAQGWSIVYVTGNANISNYLSGQTVNVVNVNNTAAGTVSLAKTGFLYITTAGRFRVTDDMTDAQLGIVDKHGLDILAYVNSGGGLYTQSEYENLAGTNIGTNQASPSYGWLSTLFPGLQAVSDSEVPINIQITAQGQQIFPGLTSADLAGGPWHNYFAGTLPSSLASVFTATNPKLSNATVILGLSSVGAVVASPLSGDQVIIDSTPPATSVLTLDPASDTGSSNSDQVTQDNNGQFPAPVFDVTNVEPNGIVKLYRAPVVNGVVGTPVLVNTITQGAVAAIGTIQIPDINGGNGVIPNGTYQYTVQQTDLAGNVGASSTPLTVVIQAGPPPAPNPFILDPLFDTGTFNNDGVTKDNNGQPFPAPAFDASAIVKNATIKLFRAPIVGGVAGVPVLVNTLTNTAGGLVPIADTNGGNGVIPDGTYAYTAQQFDLAGNIGPVSAQVTVTIDSDGPQADPPASPRLEPGSDTGTFNNDQITQDNNGQPFPAPVFDAGTAANPVEANATVELFRAPVGGGVPVLVNTLINTAGGIVPIADINAGTGKIADGTYVYTIQLIDLAGVPGSVSNGLTVIVQTAVPATPKPFRLDPASDTGVSNSDGITQITLLKHPNFDAGGVVKGATVNLYRALVTNGVTGAAVLANSLTNTAGGTIVIPDPGSLPDGQYVYTIQQVDLAGNASPIGGAITVTYDTAQPPTPPVPTLDPASDSGTKGDKITSNTSPFLDVTLTLTGFEVNSSLTLVRDGVAVAKSPYTVTSGTTSIQDPGPVPFGAHTYKMFLTDLAGNIGALGGSVSITFANNPPGTLTLDPTSDSGVKGDNITDVASPTFDVNGISANGTLRLLRNGLSVASIATGAGGTVMITDPGPLTNGKYTYTAQQVDSVGNVSPPGPALVITIDTNVPAAPTSFKLDPASDSGFVCDNITNVNKPTFDATGIIPGATVRLLRAGSVVATLTSTLGGAVQITDTGPVADGTYVYTLQQVSIAGNASPFSTPVSVKIDTSIPPGPTLVLDPKSDTGAKGDNITSILNPIFDASGVVAGASLTLFRNGVVVKTLTNVVAGTVQIQDPGPLANGSFTYTAQQTSPAGNVSLVGPPLVITINTSPPLIPTTPILVLDPTSDTGIAGDNITSVRQPLLDGNADPGVIINLFNNSGNTIATTSADSSGNFALAVPVPLTNGTYSFTAKATDAKGAISSPSTALVLKIVTVNGDYSGVGKTGLDLFRRTAPSSILWTIAGYAPLASDVFGAGALDVPLTGDFTGDGKVDPAVYRPKTGQWFVQNSSNSYVGQPLATFGWAGVDIPVPANYNGTGITQVAVYRPTTGQFFVSGSANPTTVVAGKPGDVPVPGNYDNTGKDEFAIYRPSTGQWFILGPSGVHTVTFGGPSDVPVPGAYDASATNHSAEPAVYRPSTGQWFILGPGGVARVDQFAVGDIPAAGDYDGTGVTEPAVYRPSIGEFFVMGANDTKPRQLGTLGVPTGVPNDIPTLAPYVYRALSKANTSGGVTAAAVPSAVLDFGVKALNLSAGGASSPAVASSTSQSLSPPPATPPVTIRVRPNQALTTTASHGHKSHLIDHALSSLVKGRAHRLVNGVRLI
jgi:large repetitive protein